MVYTNGIYNLIQKSKRAKSQKSKTQKIKDDVRMYSPTSVKQYTQNIK